MQKQGKHIGERSKTEKTLVRRCYAASNNTTAINLCCVRLIRWGRSYLNWIKSKTEIHYVPVFFFSVKTSSLKLSKSIKEFILSAAVAKKPQTWNIKFIKQQRLTSSRYTAFFGLGMKNFSKLPIAPQLSMVSTKEYSCTESSDSSSSSGKPTAIASKRDGCWRDFPLYPLIILADGFKDLEVSRGTGWVGEQNTPLYRLSSLSGETASASLKGEENSKPVWIKINRESWKI